MRTHSSLVLVGLAISTVAAISGAGACAAPEPE